MHPSIVAQGEAVPAALVGPLRKTPADAEPTSLRERLATDGYLYLARHLPREDVMAARRAVFSRLFEVGELKAPAEAGIHSGTSRRRTMHPDLGVFWRSVAETWALRRVTHSAVLHGTMSALFGEPAVAQDFLFLRPANRAKFTHVHCDSGFFTRCTDAVLTCWIALGDISLDCGPLFIVEGSHRFEDVIAAQRDFDVARDSGRRAALPQSPVQLLHERQTRMLTGDFNAGDILVFPMFTLHGALDNTSEENRVRLSVDVRYQPATAPRDPRYFGPEPTGTTGAGYGELTGAKPMDEPWHVR